MATDFVADLTDGLAADFVTDVADGLWVGDKQLTINCELLIVNYSGSANSKTRL
ncbi:MAG: hypothetical protein F6K35_31490 [Okeania sp. SIO2H7]|nr:hypothetical protein [Okeania sp. SIO2H7]